MADITYKINNKGSDYYLASSTYCVCSTAASTAAKVAYLQNSSSNTFNGGTVPTGITIYVKFTYSNTASNPTLNVNGSGAKTIVIYGTTKAGSSVKTSWRAGAIVAFTFDGTYWVMNTNLDSDSNVDTKNTAGATQQAGTLYMVGAPSRDANPQTYSSSNVTMYNGCVSTQNLNIQDELWFNEGAMITANGGVMNLSSENGIINVVGNLEATSVNLRGEEAATKQWVADWINDHYGESISLTVRLEQVIAGMEQPIVYFQDTTNESKSYTYNEVVPYAATDQTQINYLYFETNANNVSFNCTSTGSGAYFSSIYNYYDRPLYINYDQGTLMDQLITVVIEADDIEYVLYLRFNSPIYR